METLAPESISSSTQESLIKSYGLMVKRIAYHLLSRLPHSVQLDDLIQAGMVGLLEAFRHYDRSKGASFETYAGIRIRGYILDEVRRNDWVPRSVYRNARVIAEAVRKVENRKGRNAKDHEVAKELQVPLGDYYTMLKDYAGSQLYGFDDLGVTDDTLKNEFNSGLSEPHVQVLQEDMLKSLSHVISSLPQKEQLVLSLYYAQDLNFKEIGEILSISESRVCQIHSQAMIRIKSRLVE